MADRWLPLTIGAVANASWSYAVASEIEDLRGFEEIGVALLAEALQYRPTGWA